MREYTFSINGSLKFKPGDMMRRYLPNTVITAIVPCFTVTKHDDKMISAIKIITNNTIIEVDIGDKNL